MDAPTRICVFCGSASGNRPAFTDAAATLGRLIAERGHEVVYGGASVGLMNVVAEAALAAGGQVIGVITDIFSTELEHNGVSELHRVSDMHARKARMYELADAFIALPGGIGTLDELAETMTWVQIGVHAKPIGLVDTESYFQPLLEFFRHGVEMGLYKPTTVEQLAISPDPAEVLDQLALTRW